MTKLGDLKETTEKTTEALEWLAEVLLGKNWVRKFALAFVAVAIFGNEVILSQVLKYLYIEAHFPEWYKWSYGLVLAGLFIAALVAALRHKRATVSSAAVDIAKRSPIKLLRPWTYDDVTLFARMQREKDLRICVESIIAPDFRFGLLVGESGCGKSSFLQAGLWPRLELQTTAHPCLYVKLTEEDPIETLRRAIEERFKLPEDKLNSADLVTLLDNSAQAKGQVVVLLDQFEQFFVHRKTSEERAPFLRALAQWYTRRPPSLVKILVSFRADLFHLSLELQKAMGYALGPQESFELKKLSPDQATEVFRVMAEVEGFEFDPAFVKEMARDELASREDGLVSPVDVQILAWMMTGQAEGQKVAFDRAGYQRVGGVEGLLVRFLERALRARETDSRRQAAVKVMLALTDLERNARAGVLSVENIKDKLGSTLIDTDVEDAVAWLARNGLVTPQNRSGQQGYELAHERLIPALRRLAGKTLTEADQANQLLDRRVHEWLGNERASRYLLTWRELQRIKQQTPYLVWGAIERQKRELLEHSHRHWLRSAFALAAFVLIVGGVGNLWLSPVGQIWQLKRDLSALVKKISDPEVLIEIGESYQSSGDQIQAKLLFEKARQSAEEIADPNSRASVLTAVAEGAAKLGDSKQAAALLEKVRQSAEGITIPDWRTSTLTAVAEGAAKLGDSKQAAELLEKVRQSAEAITDPYSRASALIAVAETAAKLGDSKQAAALLEKVRQSAEAITDPYSRASALSTVAEAAAKFGDSKEAAALLEKARQSADAIAEPVYKAYAFIAVSAAAAKLGDSKKAAELLEKVRQFTEAITDPRLKASTLTAVAQAAAKLSDSKQAAALLEKVHQSAEAITDPIYKDYALTVVSGAAGKLGDSKETAELLEKFRQSAEAITDPTYKASVLTGVSAAAGKLGDSKQAAALLEKIRQSTEAMTNPNHKASTLTALAEAAAKLSDSKQAAALLEKVHQSAEAITDPDHKASTLIAVVEAAAKLVASKKAAALLEKVRQSAEAMTDPDHKTSTLTAVAEAAAKLGHSMQAAELLEKASQSAEMITDATRKDDALRKIARALARGGDLLTARRTASLISGAPTKAIAWVEILREWHAREHSDAAQKVTRQEAE